MTDVIIIAIILLIVAGASFYIYKSKKKGNKCVGCPMAKECAKKKSCCK